MYKYSPIKKVYIKNFRNIGEAIIDFEDSPIISLIGENEAGKTSIVKAFSVCALHATPRDQKDFIRDGTNGFGVAIELEDGTLITRIKQATVNKYNVKRPDGTEWDASKIDSGLPTAVQEVMGMIEEPETKEFLQVRTYEDQLLFVVTPASTNYKVMYDALKVDQLTRAIKLGSKEANGLKMEIDNGETGIVTLNSSLKGIKTYDIEPLLNIKARLSKEKREVEQLLRASELINTINYKKKQLGTLSELLTDKVKEVNEYEAMQIDLIANSINKLLNLSKLSNSISDIDALEQIDISTINSLINIVNRSNIIATKIAESKNYLDIGNADEIDIDTVISMMRIIEMQSVLYTMELRQQIYNTSGAELVEQSDFDAVLRSEQIIARNSRNVQLLDAIKQYDDYCNNVETYLKSLGVDVETCPNCGEAVIIDLDKYGNKV